MISKETFDSLTEWLIESIQSEYEASETKKYAVGGRKPSKSVISHLWAMFDERICKSKERRFRVDADGNLYAYNCRYFEKISEKTFLKELIKRVLAGLGVGVIYQINASAQIAKEITDTLSNNEDCLYKPNRRYIGFTNGVFDIKDGKLKSFNMRYCTDLLLDFEYDERASRTLWDIKLKQIIPSAGFRSDFQQFCGSLLADRTVYKKELICYLHGNGGNGKSVLASAIGGMFGENYYSTFSLQQIFSKQTNAMFVAKEMDGKLLNICDDVTAKDVSGGDFKRFVSGEKIAARGAFSKDFIKANPPMLLACLNTFPDVEDDSEGNHRRQLIIETARTKWEGDERDTQLSAKLATPEARAAIFNWIYEGYRKYVANKGDIKLSKDAIETREIRKAMSSPMRRWVYERGFVKANPTSKEDPRWKPLKNWFTLYREYCAENGFEGTRDSRVIAAMFTSMDFIGERRSGGWWYVIGIENVDTDKNGMLIY